MLDVNLQLEALREAKGWSTWVVGLGSAALAGLAVLKSTAVKQENARDSRALLLAASVGFFCAVTLVATVPFIIDQLPIDPPTQRVLWFSINGVYAYRVLNVIPLWSLQLGLYVAVAVAALFGLSIVWRQLFGMSFLDSGKRIAALASVTKFTPLAKRLFDNEKNPQPALLPGLAKLCFRSFEPSDRAEAGTIHMTILLPAGASRFAVARWLIREFESSASGFSVGGKTVPLEEVALVNALK